MKVIQPTLLAILFGVGGSALAEERIVQCEKSDLIDISSTFTPHHMRMFSSDRYIDFIIAARVDEDGSLHEAIPTQSSRLWDVDRNGVALVSGARLTDECLKAGGGALYVQFTMKSEEDGTTPVGYEVVKLWRLRAETHPGNSNAED